MDIDDESTASGCGCILVLAFMTAVMLTVWTCEKKEKTERIRMEKAYAHKVKMDYAYHGHLENSARLLVYRELDGMHGAGNYEVEFASCGEYLYYNVKLKEKKGNVK